MNRTSIAWVVGPFGDRGFTWNPAIGCTPVSSGCRSCYASRLASTRLAHLPQYAGLATESRICGPSTNGNAQSVFRWTGEVRFFPEKLAEPLLHRKPAGIFVCDMSDLFNESVTNEQIAAVFGVMAACPRHRFYVLTKRAKRRREWFEWVKIQKRGWWQAEHGFIWECFRKIIPISDTENDSLWKQMGDVGAGFRWPLPNAWMGSSICTQAEADRDIPELLETPTTLRFLSVEPMLETIDLTKLILLAPRPPHGPGVYLNALTGHVAGPDDMGPKVDWVIVGGESGTHARPFHVEWARSIQAQCKAAGTSYFLKQLGSNCIDGNDRGFPASRWPAAKGVNGITCTPLDAKEMRIRLRDRAGADPSEWPEDLRVQQVPGAMPKGKR